MEKCFAEVETGMTASISTETIMLQLLEKLKYYLLPTCVCTTELCAKLTRITISMEDTFKKVALLPIYSGILRDKALEDK